MKVGLFFGSFNPIHMGHLIIANIAHQSTDMDEVWFVVSPQNPFKKNNNLLHEFDRYNLVQAAIADDFHFRVSDVEFNMPRPSYTVDTLAVLSDKYDHEFSLIIGGDNLESFKKWKNYQVILEEFGLVVYPRPSSSLNELADHPNVQVIEAPEMDISATLIRKMIRADQSVKYLVPEPVEAQIRAQNLFK
ncbi:nicotinate (nicotinamide) nucleotide adenylyltransferase [Marinoscillum furvescens]|uniref:Probable nicotinate-nucleotide adenylyltransferase n=1 Tax=Marinoscillum furvescens DSM 4134 TaxID=1122208 RepID=A0A3D9L540_MARFU|nr:nicotinate (nicotinamide) nucleotide adenylyltransferase [Marinoscillum furvescens]RED99514.1 nicotinate-nucleotide adenylyltransferase [Marinoscillum furvescens DSM 4134]